MFGLGMGEVVIILILALLLLGEKKLPEAAKQLGKGLRELRRATDDLKSQFEAELYKVEEAVKPAAPKPTLVPPPPAAAPPAGEAGPVPYASSDNVPGLESALAPAAEAATPADSAAPAAVAAPAGATAPAAPAQPAAVAAAAAPTEPR